jgi:hypothetical protein
VVEMRYSSISSGFTPYLRVFSGKSFTPKFIKATYSRKDTPHDLPILPT